MFSFRAPATAIFLQFFSAIREARNVVLFLTFIVAMFSRNTDYTAYYWGVLISGITLYTVYYYWSYQYALTDTGILYDKKGFVEAQHAVLYQDVMHIEVSASFLARLLRLQTLYLYTNGGSKAALKIAHINNHQKALVYEKCKLSPSVASGTVNLEVKSATVDQEAVDRECFYYKASFSALCKGALNMPTKQVETVLMALTLVIVTTFFGQMDLSAHMDMIDAQREAEYGRATDTIHSLHHGKLALEAAIIEKTQTIHEYITAGTYGMLVPSLFLIIVCAGFYLFTLIFKLFTLLVMFWAPELRLVNGELHIQYGLVTRTQIKLNVRDICSFSVQNSIFARHCHGSPVVITSLSTKVLFPFLPNDKLIEVMSVLDYPTPSLKSLANNSIRFVPFKCLKAAFVAALAIVLIWLFVPAVILPETVTLTLLTIPGLIIVYSVYLVPLKSTGFITQSSEVVMLGEDILPRHNTYVNKAYISHVVYCQVKGLSPLTATYLHANQTAYRMPSHIDLD